MALQLHLPSRPLGLLPPSRPAGLQLTDSRGTIEERIVKLARAKKDVSYPLNQEQSVKPH